MGGPTRFPYGQALGWVNQFQAGYGANNGGSLGLGTAGLLPFGDTTPDVTIGDLFIANNTAATVISYFDLQNYAYKAQDYSGKTIRVMVLDQGSTRFVNSGQMWLWGTDNLATNSNVPLALYEFVQFNSSWYLINDARANRSEATVFATNAQSSLNVNGVRVAYLNNTGATTNSIIGLSGGIVGQEVNFVLVGSNAVRLLIGGNIFMTESNAMLVNASGFYKAIKFDALSWRLLAINSGGAI